MNFNKKFLMVYLLSAGLCIWNVVYLPSFFYVPFLEGFQLTHEQMGTLLSVYGILSTIGYFVGGVIADRFSAKWLMVISCVSTGALGLYMATFPPYSTLLLIYIGFGLTSTLLYWSAFLKSVRMMGDKEEQGKLFGAFESFSGLLFMGLSYLILFIFSKSIAAGENFGHIIITYSGISIFFGLLIAALYKPDEMSVVEDEKEEFNFKMLPKVFKLPITWFNMIIIFTLFIILSGGSYFNPWLNSVYMVPVSWATAVGIAIKYGFRIVGAPIGGNLIDKVGKSANVMVGVAGILIAAGIVIYMVPNDPKYMILALVVMFGFLLASNIARPVMYTPLAEGKVPVEMLGTVIGLTSAIGYSSDIWIWKFFGYLLDTHGPAGFNFIIMFMTGAAVVLLVTGVLYGKYIQKLNSEDSNGLNGEAA